MSEDTFSEQLIQFRKDGGWTQKDLADKLGTSQQNIHRWESGVMPSLEWRNRITAVIGIEPMEKSSIDNDSGAVDRYRSLMVLPLERLNEYDFEDFMVAILKCIGHKDAIGYGGKGEAQKGIDIDSMDEDNVVIQCKRIRGKFAPSDAQEAIDTYTKGGRHDKRKIMAITQSRVSHRVIEVLKKNDWAVWSSETITNIVRLDLTENQKRELVSIYFNDDRFVLKNCLGLMPDSSLISARRYFSKIGEGLVPYNNEYFLCKNDFLSEITELLDNELPRIIIISGPGGVGKTRKLREIALKTRKEILLLDEGQIMSKNDIKRALRDGSVIAIDNAQYRDDAILKECFSEFAIQEANDKKIIVLVREYAEEKVRNAIVLAGVPEEYIKKYKVKKLNSEEACDMATFLLGESSPFSSQLATVSDGIPLLLVLGSNLLLSEGISPVKLLNHGDGELFVKEIFERQLDAIFDTEAERQLGRYILGLLSVIQPCTESQLFDISKTMFGGRHDTIEMRQVISSLLSSDLTKSDGTIRITPDLFADYEREKILLGKSRKSTGVLEDIFSFVTRNNSGLLCNVLRNICQLGWRTEIGIEADKLKRQLWSIFNRMIIDANTSDRMKFLDVLRDVAYYSPREALGVIDALIQNPAKIEAADYSGEPIKNGDVAKKMANVLSVVAYNESFLNEVLEKLTFLAKEYPIPVLNSNTYFVEMKKLASFDYYKPAIYTEKVTDYVLEKGFVPDFPFPPYRILVEGLKTNGTSMSFRGKVSVEMRSFGIEISIVSHIRRKIINQMVTDINNGDIDTKNAISAAILMRFALDGPNDKNSEEELRWEQKYFNENIRFEKLNPVVSAVILAETSFLSRGDKDNGATKMLKRIPKTLENELARSIVDAWGNDTFIDENFEKTHTTYMRWLQSIAIKLIQKYSCADIVMIIQKYLDIIKEHDDYSMDGRANNVLQALCDISEGFCRDFISIILNKGVFKSLINIPLTSLARSFDKNNDVMEIVDDVLKTGDVELLQSVIYFVAISMDILPLEWGTSFFNSVMRFNDELVKRTVIDALKFLPKKYRELVAELVNSLEFNANDDGVVSAIEDIINYDYGIISVDGLLEATIDKMIDVLVKKSSLEYNDVGFLQSVVERYPEKGITMMINRVKMRYKIDSSGNDALTYSGDLYSPVPFGRSLRQKDKDMSIALRMIKNEVIRNPKAFSYYGPKMVRFLGIAETDLIDFIMNNSMVNENEGVIRICLQSLPLSVLWDADVAERIIDAVSRLLPDDVIVGDLFGLVFDDDMEMHGRTIGSLGAFELMLKDKSREMLELCSGNRTLFELYSRINKYAVSELKRQRKDDEELLG